MGCKNSKNATFDQIPAGNVVKVPGDAGKAGPSQQHGKSGPAAIKAAASSKTQEYNAPGIINSKEQRAESPRTPKRDKTSPSRTHAGAESDEDSDWDNCSNPFDLNEQGESPSPGNSPQAKPMPEPPLKFKQTATLKIDKIKGCMFVNQYLVVKFLGRGACGKVFLCLNTSDLRLYAMKAVRKVDLENTTGANTANGGKKRNPMEDLKREIMIMRKMRHTNIVTLSEVIDDPAGSKLLLVMEYMEGGPVMTREALEKKERVPEGLARKYFRDMVKSLDYLHSHKVVHGDLKPENVLISAGGDVKLSDFGCSKVFVTGNEYLERCNGTPAFLAPEMMKPNTRYRGRPTDVYAMGACLYTLVFGRIPFSAPNLYKLFQVVQNEPVRYPDDVPISSDLRQLLQALMVKNPRERISLTDVMRHSWVSAGGRFPLKPCRDLGEGESQEMHADIPPGLTFLTCNPQHDHLAALIAASPHERTFNEGDILLQQGHPGVHIVYIISGTVDILLRHTPPSSSQPSSARASQRGGGSSHGGRGGGDDMAIDESDPAADLLSDDVRQQRAQIARAATKARDLIANLLQRAGGLPGAPRELLVAQRGPGDVIGEMAMFTRDSLRTASVRCSSRVTAKVVTGEQLQNYLSQQPLLKHQLRDIILRRESESTMVEALSKLANVRDALVTPGE